MKRSEVLSELVKEIDRHLMQIEYSEEFSSLLAHNLLHLLEEKGMDINWDSETPEKDVFKYWRPL